MVESGAEEGGMVREEDWRIVGGGGKEASEGGSVLYEGGGVSVGARVSVAAVVSTGAMSTGSDFFVDD